MGIDDELYQETILEHYKSKKRRHAIANADMQREGMNPLCGDDITLFVKMNDGVIEDASFEGTGCSICIASADMLCASVIGKTLAQASAIIASFKGMLLRDQSPDFPDDLSDLEAMKGVKKFPVRIKCALLSWNTLEHMIETKEKA